MEWVYQRTLAVSVACWPLFCASSEPRWGLVVVSVAQEMPG